MIGVSVHPGVGLRVRPGVSLAMRSGLIAPPVVQPVTGALPSDIPGLLGWWDASTPAGLRSASGSAVSGFGVVAASLIARSGSASAMTLAAGSGYGANGPTGFLGRPRLVGSRGGVGATLSSRYGPVTPLVDPSLNASVPGLALGSGTARTLHLVWSRPTRASQPYGGYTSGPLTLLSIGGAPVLTLGNAGGADALTLFGTALASTMTSRHTHSVTLRWAVGGGIDAWVDDNPVATGVASAIASAATGLTLGLGTAGIYLHELAVWDHALSTADIGTLLTNASSVSKSWVRGVRKGIKLLPIGQSNASYFMGDGGAQLEESVRYHMAALGVDLSTGDDRLPQFGAGTTPGGTPLYGNPGGFFLNNPGDGSAPSTWAANANVDGVMTHNGAEELAAYAGIWCYYSENDSGRAYSEKATYKAALLAYANHLRGVAGKTAAQMPLLAISALPFSGPNAPGAPNNTSGMYAIREAVADLAADAMAGVVVVLPDTSAAWGRGAAADGTGGDNNHLDSADNLHHAHLAGPAIAQALAAAGAGDTAILPTGLPVRGGPRIVSAQRESATSILVSIQHDAGGDLLLPGGASQGWGWTVLDGYASTIAPGTALTVSAVARVSATTLRLTLPVAMAAAAGACRLHYGWGNQKIGRGSAVTDNYSAVPKPAGCDIGADLGPAWAPDMPLAVTAYPVALT